MTLQTKTVPAQLFFCVAEEVTQPEIPGFAGRAIGPLNDAFNSAGLHRAGDLHFICPEWKGPENKSRLILGIPIQADQPVAAPYFIWQAPAFTCVWKEHKGSMLTIKAAWDSLFSEVSRENVALQGSWREVYKYFEAFDSENDVTELQMGIR